MQHPESTYKLNFFPDETQEIPTPKVLHERWGIAIVRWYVVGWWWWVGRATARSRQNARAPDLIGLGCVRGGVGLAKITKVSVHTRHEGSPPTPRTVGPASRCCTHENATEHKILWACVVCRVRCAWFIPEKRMSSVWQLTMPEEIAALVSLVFTTSSSQ